MLQVEVHALEMESRTLNLEIIGERIKRKLLKIITSFISPATIEFI